MSAVMSTLSMISGGRRAHRKLASSGRKSGQFSDAGEDRSRSKHDLCKQQRSASLQTLEAGGGGAGGGGVVNLENLEAKMANIEVSLSSPRHRGTATRDVARELDALRSALSDRDTLIQSLKKQLSASLSAARLAAQAVSPTASRSSSLEENTAVLSTDERRALDDRAASVRTDLETRRTNISDLRRRLEKTHVTDNIDTRIQQAELQYKLGREELELLTLGEQARALTQLIEQADAAAERHHRPTLFSTVRECGGTSLLVAVEVREGSWAAAPRGSGMTIEWAGDHASLRNGDRLVEVNGTSVISCQNQEELQQATRITSPVRLVVLRSQHFPQQTTTQASNAFTQNEAALLRTELGALRLAADEAEKAKEGLRSDNTRLTHRISYLEEQVAELLARHTPLQSASSNDSCITVNKTKKNVTNINITSEPHANGKVPKSEVQVFQKGPDITAIVAKLPGLDGIETNLPLMRPRSNASGASSRAAASPRASPPPNHRSHSSHSLEHRAGKMRHSLSHHCIHGGADYSAETDAAIRMIERNQRHIEKQRMKTERLSRSREEYFRSDSDLDVRENHSTNDPRCYEIKKAADRIEESIKKTNWAERKTLSIIEQLKRSQRLRKLKKNEVSEDIQVHSERHYTYNRIDGKVLENAHKSSRRTSKIYPRSAKSSEFESECSDYPNGDIYSSSPRIDYSSETCSTRMSQYKKNEDYRNGEVKSRPVPPRKPLRLSLHKARSAHSLMNGSESEIPSRPPSETRVESHDNSKRPVKRTHAADKWSKERIRDAGRATPRPTRKLMNGLSACETPAADALYPESTHMALRVNGAVKGSKWC